jgi:ADP-heptose:LPS heptosyltransferase
MNPDKIRKILVVPQTNRLGDIICATPVISLIHEFNKEIAIDVLVSNQKGSWRIIKNNPFIRDIVFYEDSRYLSKLRSEKYDACFNLTNNPIPSVITFLALIPRRIKTVVKSPSKSEILTDFLNTKCSLYEHHTHLPAHYIKMLNYLGISNYYTRPTVFLSDEGEKKYSVFENSQTHGNDFIAISVTAGNKIKELSVEKFAELSERILDEYDLDIVFMGSLADEPVIKKVISLIKEPGSRVHVVCDCEIDDLPSFISRAECCIAVDTGLIYCAYALGVPTVDVVGPVDVYEQPPRGRMNLVVLPHSPSYPTSFVMRRADSEEQHKKSLELTTVDDIFDALRIVMDRKAIL